MTAHNDRQDTNYATIPMMSCDEQVSPQNRGKKLSREKHAYDCKCTCIYTVRFQSLSPPLSMLLDTGCNL